MHVNGKGAVRLLSILTGATVATVIYTSQHQYNVEPIPDRYASSDLVHSHETAFNSGLGAIMEKNEHLNFVHGVEEEVPFITHSPVNPELTFRRTPHRHLSTCPSSLHSKLGQFPWSAQYYNPAVQMIMTPALMSRKEYQRLKLYPMPFGYHYTEDFSYEELTSTLQLFTREESIFDFMRQPRPHCLTCAVVGNGGMLNGSGMGQEIDKHDMVFRVNHCIRRGHEMDVGTRTTHYVFMDRSLIRTREADIPKDQGIKWIFLPCRKKDYSYISEVAKGNNPKQKLKAQAKDIRLLHPDFVRYVHKMWMRTRSFRPSTGGMMLMTALHAGCDRLSVYGMGFNRKYTEHYYDQHFTIYKNVKGSHDFGREIDIMKQLDSAGIIKWFKRDVPEFLSS